MIYDFHGFVEVRIPAAPRGFRRYFENEYRRITTMSSARSTPRTRITVQIVKRLPDPGPGDVRRNPTVKSLFRFAYLVRGLDSDDVQIYFQRHPVDRVYTTAAGVYLQGQILEPILYAILIQQGLLLMHAAGVTDGHYAYLFPAHGGTGKTTLSLRLARVHYHLLGDDLVLVDPKAGLAYPIPRPLHLFSYNLQQMHDIKLSWRLRATIRAKDFLRIILEQLLKERFLISTRAHVDQVLPNVDFGRTTPYRRILFLTRSHPSGNILLCDETTRTRVARIIIDSGDLNKSFCSNILNDESTLRAFERMELCVVKSVLARLSAITFINPRDMDANDVAQLARDLRN